MMDDCRDLLDQQEAQKKASKKLLANRQKIRERILQVKQQRSEIHEKLYAQEVEYHLSEQERVEIEGLQFFVTDLEELVKRTPIPTPTTTTNTNTNSSPTKTNTRRKPDSNITPADITNFETLLVNLTSTFRSINQLEHTKQHLLAMENMLDDFIAKSEDRQ